RIARAGTTGAGVDDREFVGAVPGRVVDVDVTGYVYAARQIACVVLARRFELFRQRRHVAILPDGVGAADRQPIRVGYDTHRLGECSEGGREPALVGADDDGLTRLIRGDDQTDPQPIEQVGQIRGVNTA